MYYQTSRLAPCPNLPVNFFTLDAKSRNIFVNFYEYRIFASLKALICYH